MRRLTFALDRGYAPSCDVLDTMVSIHHDVDNIVHKLFSFVIDELKESWIDMADRAFFLLL